MSVMSALLVIETVRRDTIRILEFNGYHMMIIAYEPYVRNTNIKCWSINQTMIYNSRNYMQFLLIVIVITFLNEVSCRCESDMVYVYYKSSTNL